MIVVSGASGNLGRLTLHHLLQRTSAARIRALSRTPELLADTGVTALAADFDKPGALVHTLRGAERFLIISIPTPDRLPKHQRAIEAAVKAEVGHVVFTSLTRAGEPGNPHPMIPDYGATERLLIGSGLPFTVLRFNVWIEMLMLLGIAQAAVANGTLPSNSGNGGVGYLTRDDSAAVAAAVLAEGSNKGEILDVTGPEAVTEADIANVLSHATGKPIAVEPVSDREHAAALVKAGIPDHYARAWSAAGVYRRQGWFDVTTHAVERLTGRPAQSIDDYFLGQRTALLGP